MRDFRINFSIYKFLVKFHFTDEEVKNYLLPRNKIIYTYVISKTEIVNGKKSKK